MLIQAIQFLMYSLQISIAQKRGALIGGGIPAKIENFPWKAFVGHTDSKLFCGGSIISARYVMTAAHCFNATNIPDLIIFGASNITGRHESPENFTITSALKVINHPEYEFISYDVALLLVKDRIQFSKTIRPIHLPFTNIENLESYKPYVAGYGVNLDYKYPQALYYIYVEILTDEECEKLDKYFDRKTKICLRSTNGKGVCGGDSGSSLIIQYKKIPIAVGIVSYGTDAPCFTENTTEVFTRVNYFLPWILNVTSEKIND